MRFKPLSLALLGLIVTLVAAAAYLLRDSALYYPYVVVEVPESLQLTFLLKGRARESECESATATISNLLQTGCPTCRTKVRQCLGALTREQGRLAGDEALDTPSIRLPDGVVTYRSPDGKFALAACMESEKQSISTSSRLHCSPAGDMRPVPAERRATTLFGLQATSLAWLAIGVLALASFVYLVQGRLPGLIAGLPAWPRRRKRLLILIVDVLSIELTLWLAFTLRLDSLYVPQGDVIILFALAPAIAVPIFVWFGLYRSIIRYLGVQAISSIAKATAIYIAILTFAVYMLGLEGTPRSTLLVHGVLALLAIAASRAAARTWINRSQASARDGMPRKNVVIYGAGSAGVQLATALAHSKELRPVAFLDDDARLHRNRVGELEVYPPNSLNELINRFDVQEVLLAVPSTSRHRRNEIIDLLELLPVQVRTLPGLSELAEGKIKTDDLREVDIEDLLGRDPVAPDPRLLRAIVAGKTVMVTGAGGSIGAELCRQIVVLRPKCLVLFEQSEFALYSIEMELLDRAGSLIPVFSPAAIVPLLGSVTDQIRIERVIGALRIETIFHAAAYKHVPMVEKNPCEGVFNNVFGTFRAAQAAVKHGVATFVLVSTDKAVRPTNTMGASKRFAEMIPGVCQRDGSASAGYSLRHRALRKRPRVLGIGRSVIPGANSPWRTRHRNRPAHHPVLHDHIGGDSTRHSGRSHGHRRGRVRTRHGRPREDSRSGAAHDPPEWPASEECGPPAWGRRDRLFRAASGRKTLRRVADW